MPARDPKRQRQIREGVELAVKLADLLQRHRAAASTRKLGRLKRRPTAILAFSPANPYKPSFRSIPAGS